jgi:DNA-binding NtrC family response regulator
MQAKLLRVLETREVRRLGGRASISVDVRVISATWAPLETRIAEGTFREDLFHRIAVLVLEVPALRERRADILPIAQSILASSAGELGPRVFSPCAASRLCAEGWPGNVRELRNVVYRAAAQSRGAVIEAEDVARALISRRTSRPPPADARRSSAPPPAPRPARDPQAALLLLESHGGSIAAAARAFGVPRETMRDWIRFARRRQGGP